MKTLQKSSMASLKLASFAVMAPAFACLLPVFALCWIAYGAERCFNADGAM